jgi:hypothetical protein
MAQQKWGNDISGSNSHTNFGYKVQQRQFLAHNQIHQSTERWNGSRKKNETETKITIALK